MRKTRLRRSNRSQRGVTLIWFMVSLTLMLGMAAYAVDIGYWYYIRAHLRRAADAAALAAAQWRLDGNSQTAAEAEGQSYAEANGATWNTPTWSTDTITVDVSMAKPIIFSEVFGLGGTTLHAKAQAKWVSTGQISNPQYGIGTTAAYNFSIFGPMGWHQYGDEYDTKYLDNDAQSLPSGQYYESVNPLYQTTGYLGSNFDISFGGTSGFSSYKSAAGTSEVAVQIYDPATLGYNTDSGDTTAPGDPLGLAATDSTGNWAVPDEWRDPVSPLDPSYKTESTHGDTTWYTVQYKDTSGNWDNATAVTGQTARVAYTAQAWTEGQWIEDPNLIVDPTTQTNIDSSYDMRVNVTTTNPTTTNPTSTSTELDGSSENGFNLRVGPPLENPSGTSTFDKTQHATFLNVAKALGLSTTTSYAVQAGSSPTSGMAWNVTMGQATTSSSASSNYPYMKVPQMEASETSWASKVGTPTQTGIAADGHIEVNFNDSSTAVIDLGSIPASYAGDTIDITRFDTDVGASSVTYYMGGTVVTNTSGGKNATSVSGGTVMLQYTHNSDGSITINQTQNSANVCGKLFGDGNSPGGNDAEATDQIVIPSSYNPGSSGEHWYAMYSASSSDTSDWSISFAGPSGDGYVELVSTPGSIY